MLRKIEALFKIPFIFKNWIVVVVPVLYGQLLYFLGRITRRIRRQFLYVIELRNGPYLIIRGGWRNDIGDLLEIYNKQVYTPKWFLNLFKNYTMHLNDIVILDIGASTGDFSIFMARLMPKAKIFSYEPVLKAFKLLQANISLNGVGNIQTINKAISNAEGKIKAEGEEVSTIPFVDVITQLKHINLLKLDIEGGEFDIILNASYEMLSRIDFITMELHTLYNSQKYLLFVKHLEKAGFHLKSSFKKTAQASYLYAVRLEILNNYSRESNEDIVVKPSVQD